MAKLYPPVIPGTIPAFSGTSIEVPFSMNKAVSMSEISGLVLKIKKINGATVGTLVTRSTVNPAHFSTKDLPKEMPLVQGEYYKVQLAYINAENGEIGIFSTVATVKYTSKPLVYIKGLDYLSPNSHNYIYTGIYQQAEYEEKTNTYNTKQYDVTEKLYASHFYIFDEKHQIVQDSGEILHNTNADVNTYEAYDTFEYYEDLDMDKQYYIQYEITTSNGMKVKSPSYKLSQQRSLPMTLNAHLEVKNNFETGTITVNLVEDDDKLATGQFALSRASSHKPNKWEILKEFSLKSEHPTCLLYTDYTVEQGITYKYSLQQYNTYGIYSERKVSDEIVADFEDLFLYDGKRQLAIRFNPKVSTFKQNKIEQKTETIGSKYPFIIRNGAVDYKELAISGLISYQMDALEQFMTKEELELPFSVPDQKHKNLHDLITDNIKAERLFKTEVLSWLHDGKVKLFRSPTEGNFIVRLMNITTSPMDQLGRMLHTFNCTAYEIAEPTHEALLSAGIIAPIAGSQQTLKWKTIDLQQVTLRNQFSSSPQEYIQLNFGSILGIQNELDFYSIDLEGMIPGQKFLLGKDFENSQQFYIGVTGSYHYRSDEPKSYIAIPAYEPGTKDFIQYEGFLTFSYKSSVKSDFDLVTNVQIVDVVDRQFIGNAYELNGKKNIINYLTNIKDSILDMSTIKLQSRVIKPLYCNVEKTTFYLTEEAQNGYSQTDILDQLEPFILYKLYNPREEYLNIENEDYYLDVSFKETPPIIEDNLYVYLDPSRSKYNFGAGILKAAKDMDLYNVNINNDSINMYDVSYRTFSGFDGISTLSIGPGVIASLTYQKQSCDYNFEREDESLRLAKYRLNQTYQRYDDARKTVLKTEFKDRAEIGTYWKKIDILYQMYKQEKYDYLIMLEDRIQSYKKENDLNE